MISFDRYVFNFIMIFMRKRVFVSEMFRRVLGARQSLNLAPRGLVRKDACE